MDDEHLILLVQANECLYNKFCPAFKLAEKKKNVWRQISAEMQIPGKYYRTLWNLSYYLYTNCSFIEDMYF